MALIQLALPIVVILAFINFKLNHEQKRWLFKCPIWISSTVMSLGLAHFAGGVMGFYAAAFCDLMLYPAMLLVKRGWTWKEKKLEKQTRGTGSKILALPTAA
jgi:hypothetical protein